MPELPEVETIASQLRARGVEGRTIESVKVSWAKTVEPLSVAAFRRELVGAVIEKISRVGKWMMFSLSTGKTIMIHLRMSGACALEKGNHDRLTLTLSDGLTIYYRDPRKFGRWKVVDDPEYELAKLGPDALTRAFTLRYFSAAMKTRGRAIKPVLLDQSIVAGLGNIYVDEALWEARIHPERPAKTLNEAEVKALHKAIKHVLRVGVENRGTSLGEGKSNYRDVEGSSGDNRAVVNAYGRGGKPCPRCSTRLEKKVVAQRGTTFCPRCQRV